jgi:sulfide:quinone oxidoreductase
VDQTQTIWSLRDAAPQLPGVDLRLNTTVLRVDLERKTVTLSDAPETPLEYDSLVLSPGVVGDASEIPGLSECVDMYSLEDVQRQKTDIETIVARAKEGIPKQTLAVVVAAVPYKCPVAPFETAFLADDYFRRRGVRDSVDIVVTAPVAWPLPDSAREIFETYLSEKNIAFMPNRRVQKIERRAGTASASVCFSDGARLENVSALWTVYPQTAPAFMKRAGLTNQAGFVPARIDTNVVVSSETARFEEGSVFCVGDCAALSAQGKPHPKAGEFAWQMGEMVAHAVLKTKVYEHSRRGACIAECGGGAGVLVAPDFTSCVEDPENGSPTCAVEDKREGGEACKMEWVGKYVTRIFGEKGRKFIPNAAAA